GGEGGGEGGGGFNKRGGGKGRIAGPGWPRQWHWPSEMRATACDSVRRGMPPIYAVTQRSGQGTQPWLHVLRTGTVRAGYGVQTSQYARRIAAEVRSHILIRANSRCYRR